MNDSLDQWLSKCPPEWASRFYEGLAKARGQTAEECAKKSDMLGATKNAEVAAFYAERAKTIGAFLRTAA